MTKYHPDIDEWIYLVKGNHIEHCREQDMLLDNNIIPALERKDVYIDYDKLEKGFSLEKYMPFKLLPWERFQFAIIAGFYLKKDGQDDIYFHVTRDIMGRGSGKNGFVDFLALYFISPFHGVRGYNVDLIANGEDQAGTSIKDLYAIITDPEPQYAKALKANFKATAEKITGKKMNAEFRLNTTSTKNKDSKRTGAIIYDEKHEYMDTRNMNTLKSGLGKVPFWREITITTDGHNRGGVLDDEKQQNEVILREYNPDNRTFVNWFKIEDEREWCDIKKIEKANPSILHPSFMSLRTTIEMEIADMPTTPEYYAEFLAKRCNFPISDPQKAVAQWEDIVACKVAAPFEIEDGTMCVGGVDYSKSNDFVGCVLLFRKGGYYHVMHHSFICAASKHLESIRAPWREWMKAGYCELVNDVEVSPSVVVGWFLKMSEKYYIRMIGVDNFRFSLLNDAFKKAGFEALPSSRDDKRIWLTRPSDIVKASPIINSLFVTRKLTGFDPMMCWYVNNTMAVWDKNGNITYAKIEPKSRKTDGFMALVNAVCCNEFLPEDVEYPEIDMGALIY